MNGVSQLAPKQPRSVSPIACIADSTNEGSMATNGNHLTVPFSATLNGNGSAVISVDHVRNLSFDHRHTASSETIFSHTLIKIFQMIPTS